MSNECFIDYNMHTVDVFTLDGKEICQKVQDGRGPSDSATRTALAIYGVDADGIETWVVDFGHTQSIEAVARLEGLKAALVKHKSAKGLLDCKIRSIIDSIERGINEMNTTVYAERTIKLAIATALSEWNIDEDKLSISVENNDGYMEISPDNLYTLLALTFPEYTKNYSGLFTEGTLLLPNGVSLNYTDDGGGVIIPVRPVDFIRMNVEVLGE